MPLPVLLLLHAASPVRQTTVTLTNGVMSGSKVDMPIMAAGTGGYKGTNATHAIQRALAAGFSHIHTAYDYYNLKEIGDALKMIQRNSFFLSSMTSPCIHPASPPRRNVTDPTECRELTLKEASMLFDALGVTTIDLLMLHGPAETFGHVGGCSPLACTLAAAQWEAYVQLLESGRVRSIGVSNFCQSCLECLAAASSKTSANATTPAVNQIQVHVGQGSSDPGPGLVSYCKAHGIVVQAYEPLAGGALATDEFCAAIGLKHQKSAAQVALRWVLDRVPALAVRAGSAAHLAQDLDIFDFELDGSDLMGLDSRQGPVGEAGGRCSWGCTE